MTIQISVIGLNQVGASIGLTIKAAGHAITLVGCDLDPIKEQKAGKMAAFDKTVHNLLAGVENADIVVLALPADEVRKTIEVISRGLKPGAVVLDTSALKSAAQNWAESVLPEETYLISFFPTLNPEYLREAERDLTNAHADLFKNSLIMIGPNENTHPDAVKLAADLAKLLGAEPFFCDPAEAEGLTALVHHLPQLTAAALYHAVESQPGWLEGRKIAGSLFLSALEPLTQLDERKELGQALLLNSENTVRVLDAYMAELQDIREMIARQDAQALQETLQSAVDGRVVWLDRRQTRDWDRPTAAQKTGKEASSGQWLGRLFGGNRLKDLDDSK